MSKHTASNNTGPGGTIHIGTAVVTHGGPHTAGTLPFTGFDAIPLLVAGAFLCAAGWASRRRAAGS